MPDVGELFVRVRPDAAGFTEEADAGTANAGRSLAKVFVAAFAAVGVGDIIKRTVEAAVQQQQQFAILNKTVSNAGAANEVHGQSIDNLVKQQAALKGFSVADVSSALGKLESVTKNSAQSFQLLGAAENLARGTGKELTVSALAVQKAFEGSATSLARYGIIIKPVTTDVERLKEGWAKLRDESVQFTAQQTAQQAIQLKNATLADKLLTGQEAIAAIQQRFGGESAAFAKTAAGEWDRLKVSVDQLAVTVGTELLPSITSGISQVAKWADELSRSVTVQHDAATAGHDLSVAFHDIEDAGEVVGPIIGEIAQDTLKLVSAVGAPPLLAAAGVYLGIKAAVGVASIAQNSYNTVIAAGAKANAAATGAAAANTTATTANTAAKTANSGESAAQATANAELAAGTSALTLRIEAATAATTEEAIAFAGAAREAEIAAASTTTVASRFGSGLAALAVSPTGITLGLAAVAAGVIYLTGREESWSDANNKVTSSIQELSTALADESDHVGTLGEKFAQIAAVARTEVTDSIAGLATKTQEAIGTFGHATELTDAWLLALDKQRSSLEQTNPVLAHDITLVEQLTVTLGKIPPTTDIQLLINNESATASLASILGGFEKIEQFVAGLSALTLAPTSGQAASIYSARTSPAIAAEYAAQEAAAAVKSDVTGGKTHATLTEAAKLAIEQLREGIANADQQQADLNQQMQDAVQQGAISVEQAVQQAQQNFITIGQSIATDIGTYIDTPLTLAGNALQLQADRIAQIQAGLVTRFAQQNALLDQETNRISLRAAQLTLHEQAASVELPGGKALSANPATALRELERLQRTATPAGKFALQQLIDSYQGDVIAVKKAQEQIVTGALNVKTAQHSADIAGKNAHLKVLQDMATNEKTAATNSINDWAAEWEKKKITLGRFFTDVNGLIKRDIGSLGNIAKIPGGQLLESQLRGALTGLGQQALAIEQGPQQLGAGFLPTITHPLTALQNEQKQIASIAHSDASNQLTIQTDQRNILKAIYGAQKNTTGLGSLAKATPATLRAELRAALAGLPGG